MEYINKEARYDLYCSKCKHWLIPETEEPCTSCLDQPYNEHSQKPICFEERK